MTKKRTIGLWLTLVMAIVAGVVIFYIAWRTPYAVPKVNADVSLQQSGIDFTNERHVMQLLSSAPNSADLPQKPEDVTKDNAPLAYFLALQLNGQASTIGQGTSIAFLMQAVKADPENMVYSNELRRRMVADGKTDQAITFFQNVQTDAPQLKLQLALVYIDQLQNPELGTASLGQKSSLSIQVLNDILDKHPSYWLAHYARGLNNLYWPKGLQRTDKAIQDLQYCLAVADQLNDPSFAMWPLAYTAYGDALVKSGKVRQGIRVWEQGTKRFPNDPDLKSRSGKNEAQAFALVKQQRGIDLFQRPDPDISDLSMLWKGRD